VSKSSSLVNITSPINELNLILQWKDKFLYDLYRIINWISENAVILWSTTVGKSLFSFFCFKVSCVQSPNMSTSIFREKKIKTWSRQFCRDFQVFAIFLSQNSFVCNLNDASFKLHLDIIDLNANDLNENARSRKTYRIVLLFGVGFEKLMTVSKHFQKLSIERQHIEQDGLLNIWKQLSLLDAVYLNQTLMKSVMLFTSISYIALTLFCFSFGKIWICAY
jgi:hypothetical protein